MNNFETTFLISSDSTKDNLDKFCKEFEKWRNGELIKDIKYIKNIPPYPINYYSKKNNPVH